jgi:peptidoglycan/xylan/chitin deacetylase (PgdA/CDA1 family)
MRGVRRGQRVAIVIPMLAAVMLASPITAQNAPQRAVALTFDDLPAVTTRHDSATYEFITSGILATLVRERAPATGFVIERLLFVDGRLDPMRVNALSRWLAAGMELGNHTYSHRSLHQTETTEYLQDIARGDTVLRQLLAERGKSPRWFRHPMLHTGTQAEARSRVDDLLHKLGYQVAPVTIDNSDFLFARAYDNALDQRNTEAASRVEHAYLAYMDTVFGYYEQQSRNILGYELPQILLLHANRLNASTLDQLIAMMKRRGYRFSTLEAAFADPAYRRKNEFMGNAGITWLHRWALADGRRGAFFAGEPEVPAFINELANIR